ncbi:MAG: grasp-with-spasm system ATP-grasp peptide maturase [Bacteroidales bacterium]|jgi:ATP-GRASP peptide maturase of grasp-with-spasm system|nr:grasp-with-spasm system ATP-grasp peptide maturase [Bacteroidales bacterium]
MILIISSYSDVSTNKVISWLKYYNYPYYRINFFEDISTFNLKIVNNNFHYEFKEPQFCLNNISAVWYRRFPELKEKTTNEELNILLLREFKAYFNYFIYKLEDRYWLNHRNLSSMNKLWVLEQAMTKKLKIPDTIITNEKKELLKFIDRHHQKVITKPIFEVANFHFNNVYSTIRTNLITDIEMLPEYFSPSLFQEYIEKEIELRIVYLEGNFYSMGILSQQNNKTLIDFRNYDMENPNRYISIDLPADIKQKLTELMCDLKLNFGSIDMILSKNGLYYFLEVNPIGQFGMVSSPLNYNIEKKIAELLIKKSDEYKQRK